MYLSPSFFCKFILIALCRYRSTSNVKLPLRIIPTVTEVGTTQVTYIVTVKANFNNKLSATSVVLRIPTPLNTTTVDCKVPNGKAKYVPAENVVVWKYVFSFYLPMGILLMPIIPQDPTITRWSRNHFRSYSRFDKYNSSASMGSTAH